MFLSTFKKEAFTLMRKGKIPHFQSRCFLLKKRNFTLERKCKGWIKEDAWGIPLDGWQASEVFWLVKEMRSTGTAAPHSNLRAFLWTVFKSQRSGEGEWEEHSLTKRVNIQQKMGQRKRDVKAYDWTGIAVSQKRPNISTFQLIHPPLPCLYSGKG